MIQITHFKSSVHSRAGFPFRASLVCVIATAVLAACGGGGSTSGPANVSPGGNTSGNTSGTVSNPGSIAVFAGNMGGYGNADGIGTDARFRDIYGIALDANGTVYASDGSRVRKITQAGAVSTFAGGDLGYAEGTGGSVKFSNTKHMVTDAAGNLYVLDTYSCVIRKLTPAAVSSTLAGKNCSYIQADGQGSAASFAALGGVTIDSSGNLYVSDEHTIRKVSPTGVVSTLAGQFGVTGAEDGAGSKAHFRWPAGLAADDAGNVYVADSFNHSIRKLSAAGVVSTLAGKSGEMGSADGEAGVARFNAPLSVVLDTAGQLYVADTGNRVIRKISSAGIVSTIAGSAGQSGADDGTGQAARFAQPVALARDSAGNLYVSDFDNKNLRKINAAGAVSTMAGAAAIRGDADGIGAAARFNSPGSFTADSSGNLYLTDWSSQRQVIRKLSPAGVVTTLAGTPNSYKQINGITTDASGNLYVAQSVGTVSQISPTGVLTNLAGTAYQFALVDGKGSDARFKIPNGIVSMANGDMLVTDTMSQAVRKLSAGGVVTTYATLALSFGEIYTHGNFEPAEPSNKNGMVMDSSGNVYIADGGKHVIYKLSSNGVSTIFAGASGINGSADGSAAAARFNRPQGLTIDNKGNLYVADTDNHTIRKITPAGVVSTIVGVAGQEGFAAGSLPGALSKPQSVVFSNDALYITTYQGVAVVRNF